MDWIDIVEREGRALSVAARHDFRAEVPTCPGWDVDQLLRHVGEAHHNAEAAIREQRDAPPTAEQWQSAPDIGSLDWFEAGHAALLDTMRSADPTTPVWTFGADKTAAFWFRRIAHETTVHRIDAELATGAMTAIDPAFAVDGVDEALDVFVPMAAKRAEEPASGTLHLHATDADGEWLLTFGDRRVGVERGHAKGDAAVRGPAADLYLWVWGRKALDDLEVIGDRAAAVQLERYRF